jgi:hypothetical protein
MHKIFRQTYFFVVGYSILMAPTYVLPWLGSNSSVFNVAGATVGHGMTPQWWVHAWCLVMLILMAWLRGNLIGKKYLPAFPFLAAVFDMTPGLSMIPLVPTALHLTTIIIGLKVGAPQANTDGVVTSRKVCVLAGLMTITAISGSLLFVSTTKESFSELARQKDVIPVKSNPPLSVTAPTPPELVGATPDDPEKIDRQQSSHIDSEKHSASNKVKRKPVEKRTSISNKSPTHDDVSEIRYININE